MPTIEERENLLPTVKALETGFTSRAVVRRASQRRPRSLIDIECQHVLRTTPSETVHGRHPVEYRLWLEAGKLNLPPASENPYISHSSQTWRNFQRQYRDVLSMDSSASSRRNNGDNKVSESVASIYPVTIPSPSYVGEFTYAKFLAEVPVIKGHKLRMSVLRQVQKDIDEFKRLRLRSELRDPPLTKSGQISPPENYRRYPRHAVVDNMESASEPQVTPLQSNEQLDMFGRRVPRVKKSGALPWKLEYRINNPEYDKVRTEMTSTGSSVAKPSIRMVA